MIECIYKRKSNFIQYQITDYINQPTKEIFVMKDPIQYRRAKKALSFRKKPKKRGRKRQLNLKKFKNISSYLVSGKKNVPSANYLLRFPHITPQNLNIVESPLRPDEIILYRNIEEFHGFFDDLFFFNDLSFFDFIDNALDAKSIRIGAPSLHDMLIFEFARIHSGNETYSGFLRNFTFFGVNNFKHLLYEPKFIPKVQDFSRMFHNVPSSFFIEYFNILLDELMESNLLCFKILMWDCQFVHSNSSDYKDRKTKKYSDLEAGIGRHNNKFLGVGYMVSTLYLYCGNLIVPVYCVLFPANMNDKIIFYETMKQYFQSNHPYPEVVLADSGGYSLKNLEYMAQKGIIPVINSTKNIKKQNVVKIKRDLYLNLDFLPKSWTTDDFKRIYAIRTSIERCFSHNIQLYNARRMNTRGIEQATIHRYLILILDLLKILTSFKVGRPDLFQTYTAFSRMKEGVPPESIQYMLKNQGYKLLDKHFQVANSATDWDGWRKNRLKYLRR